MTLHFYISETLGLHGSGVLVFTGKVHMLVGLLNTRTKYADLL